MRRKCFTDVEEATEEEDRPERRGPACPVGPPGGFLRSTGDEGEEESDDEKPDPRWLIFFERLRATGTAVSRPSSTTTPDWSAAVG